MKIVSEMALRDFQFWSGAKDVAAELTTKQLDQVETILQDIYPDGMADTQINDLFWFDYETIYEWLGIKEEYPMWASFKSHLGNERFVQIDDEYEKANLVVFFEKHGIKYELFENDDEPLCTETLYTCDADYDDWMWEEDNGHLEYSIWVPKEFAFAYINGDMTGLQSEEDVSAYNKFLAEYGKELADHDNFECYWDTDNVEFRSAPDFGDGGQDCIILRIYSI